VKWEVVWSDTFKTEYQPALKVIALGLEQSSGVGIVLDRFNSRLV
jgi:hypothetical protein